MSGAALFESYVEVSPHCAPFGRDEFFRDAEAAGRLTDPDVAASFLASLAKRRAQFEMLAGRPGVKDDASTRAQLAALAQSLIDECECRGVSGLHATHILIEARLLVTLDERST